VMCYSEFQNTAVIRVMVLDDRISLLLYRRVFLGFFPAHAIYSVLFLLYIYDANQFMFELVGVIYIDERR
jgi:hypothetical protein